MRARALINAQVLPMPASGDRPAPWEAAAEAILWVGDRIQRVGGTSSVLAEAHRLHAAVEDLGGRVVLPGFVDAHMHFLHAGVKGTRPDLGGCRNLDEALARLAQWLEAHPGPEPVIGEHWDESGWGPRVVPTRRDLDRVAAQAAAAGHGPPDRPLVARRICGHVAVANTAALPALRAHWDNPNLVDLESGLLLEQPSLYLNEVLPVSPAGLDRAVQEACRLAHRLGVTAVGDYSQAPYRGALRRAAAAGTLSVRIHSSIYVQQLEEELRGGFTTTRPQPGPDGAPSPWLRDGGLKVFLDGSLGARSAALREPYADAPPGLPSDCGGRRDSRFGCVGHPHPQGTLNWSDAEVRRLFARAHGAGVQIHAHAIGDAAIDQGLAFFGELASGGGPGGEGGARWAGNALRHRFEHYEIVREEQMEETSRLGLLASSQPNFAGSWSAQGGMYHDRLGERFRLGNRFRTMRQRGLRVAFGSDGMPFGPLVGIQAAVRHPDPEQRMGPGEALWHYTAAAAHSLHWEAEIGSLRAGAFADLVVLDAGPEDLTRKPPTSWGIRETIGGGVTRFRAGSIAPS